MTCEGIPVHCWVLPGNQHDAKSVYQIQQDLDSWKLGRVVWVLDRGMSSEYNRRILQEAGGQFILGEKLRSNQLSEEALNRAGRFKVVNEKVPIKEVMKHEGSLKRRYVIVYNPEQARYDRIIREHPLERLQCELEQLNTRHSIKAKCEVLLHPSMKHHVKELKSGTLKIDNVKVKVDLAPKIIGTTPLPQDRLYG